jgi:hypothetical protein
MGQFEFALKGHGFTACGKTPDFDFVLKGRGFSRAIAGRPGTRNEVCGGKRCAGGSDEFPLRKY